MAKYPKGMPGRQAATTKRRKVRKVREMNPVKLVLDRGLRTITKQDVDEDGKDIAVQVANPQGVVLGPFQVQALAAFLNAQQRQIQVLDAIVENLTEDDDQEDEDEADA